MPTIRSILQRLEINTAETILDECNDLSTRGKVYEGLWDIAFKFKCVIPKAVHYTTHQNKVGLYKLKDYKRKFLDCEVGTNSSGWSDITFKINEQIYMATCKYIESKSIDKWDICKVKDVLARNGCIEPNVLVLTKNTEEFHKTLNRSNNKDLYAPHIHKVFDLANLEVYLEQVCEIMEMYNWDIDSVVEFLESEKTNLQLKFHQKLCLIKTMKMDKTPILWGLKSRSGKSYIMAAHILLNNNKNSLIVTSYPNESILQLTEMFNSHIEFKDFEIILCSDKSKISDKRAIYIMSKQILDRKMGLIKAGQSAHRVFDVQFDVVYFDETHQGGITEKTDQILKTLKHDHLITITATFDKPLYNWNIQPANCFFWDLEDEQRCKRGEIDYYL